MNVHVYTVCVCVCFDGLRGFWFVSAGHEFMAVNVFWMMDCC